MFSKDLNRGAIGEAVMWKCLSDRPSVRQIIDVRNDKRSQADDIDFLIENNDRQIWKVEVKTDYFAHNTGNIAYELTSCGNKGCFARTKADFVFYYLPDANKALLISVRSIRLFLQRNSYEIRCMGDGATGYLIPIEDLFEQGVLTNFNVFEEVM